MRSEDHCRPARKPGISRLDDHPEPYVTVGELAAYWLVSRKQVYKQIDAGTLAAIRLGPRLLRIRTSEALRFERYAKMRPVEHAGMPDRPDVPMKPVKMQAHGGNGMLAEAVHDRPTRARR